MRAALRDASWHRRPSSHGKKLVYHVVRDDLNHEEGACGVPVIAVEGYAPGRDVTVPAESVRPEQRCGRPGCKAKWPHSSEDAQSAAAHKGE